MANAEQRQSSSRLPVIGRKAKVDAPATKASIPSTSIPSSQNLLSDKQKGVIGFNGRKAAGRAELARDPSNKIRSHCFSSVGDFKGSTGVTKVLANDAANAQLRRSFGFGGGIVKGVNRRQQVTRSLTDVADRLSQSAVNRGIGTVQNSKTSFADGSKCKSASHWNKVGSRESLSSWRDSDIPLHTDCNELPRTKSFSHAITQPPSGRTASQKGLAQPSSPLTRKTMVNKTETGKPSCQIGRPSGGSQEKNRAKEQHLEVNKESEHGKESVTREKGNIGVGNVPVSAVKYPQLPACTDSAKASLPSSGSDQTRDASLIEATTVPSGNAGGPLSAVPIDCPSTRERLWSARPVFSASRSRCRESSVFSDMSSLDMNGMESCDLEEDDLMLDAEVDLVSPQLPSFPGVMSVDSGVSAANGDAIQVQQSRFLRVGRSNADLPGSMPVQVQGRRPRVSRHLSLRLNEEPGGPTEMALWRHLPQEFTSIKTLLLKLKRTLQEDCTAERMATPTESPTDGLPKHSFENSGMSAELLQIRSQLHMRDTEIKTLKERLFAAEIERVRWREGLTSRQDKCTQTDGHTQSRGVFQEPEHSSTCLQCLNQVGYNSPRKETTKMDPPGKTVKEVITGCQIVNKEEQKEAIQGPGKTSTTRKISAPTSRLSKLPKHRGSRSEVS